MAIALPDLAKHTATLKQLCTEAGRDFDQLDVSMFLPIESSQPRRTKQEVSSSNFPHFDRNLNTGRPIGVDAELRTAEQTIFHDHRYRSHLILPVIPR